MENNLLSDYKNETIGTDPLVLFYFHHAIFVFMFVIMQYVKESFTLVPSYFYAIHPYAEKYVRIIRSHVPPSHLVLFSSLLLYKRHPPNFYYYFILSK